MSKAKTHDKLPEAALIPLQAMREVFIGTTEAAEQLAKDENYGHDDVRGIQGITQNVALWCRTGKIKMPDGRPGAFYIEDTRMLGGGRPRWLILREAWNNFVPPSVRRRR